MANSERDFYAEIRKATDNQLAPSHCFKYSDSFVSGIPDLVLTTQRFGLWMVECKFLRRSEKATDYPLEMTELQRRFMKRQQEAGGQCGWALCVRYSDRLSHCYVGTDYAQLKVQKHAPHIVRGHGQEWDAFKFYELLRTSNGFT